MRRVVKPFEAEGESGKHEVVVDPKVLFGLVEAMDFKLRDVVLRLGGDEKVVGGKDLELFSLVLIVVLRGHS